MNGPFLIGTGHVCLLPLLAVTRADDQPPGRLGAPGAVAHRGLAPRRLRRHPGRGLALAAAVRMVTWVHDDAADLRPLAHVAGAAGLAEVLVLVVEVADLADRGHAADADPPDLARRQPDLGVRRLPWRAAGRRCRRTGRSGRPCPGRARCCGSSCRAGCWRSAGRCRRRASASGPATIDVTDLQAVRQEHVALLAVAVEEQPDPGGAVRVVLDRREARRHAELVALEVDPAVVLLLAAAAMADGEPARRCSGRSRASAARAAACTARRS